MHYYRKPQTASPEDALVNRHTAVEMILLRRLLTPTLMAKQQLSATEADSNTGICFRVLLPGSIPKIVTSPHERSGRYPSAGEDKR